MTRVETEIEGEVSAVSQRGSRYAVKIGDTWYGGFGLCPVAKGSKVVLRFYEKDDWKNVVSIRLLEGDESVLSDEEMAEVLGRFRERGNVIAEQCIEDAASKLKRSGIQGAATPRNVIEWARELHQRRAVHVTWFLNRYLAEKRLRRRKSQATAERPTGQRADEELREWAV